MDKYPVTPQRVSIDDDLRDDEDEQLAQRGQVRSAGIAQDEREMPSIAADQQGMAADRQNVVTDRQAAGVRPQQVESATIPVVQEQVDIRKEKMQTATVRVSKSVEERDQHLDIPLDFEQYEITRVAVNQEVDGPVGVRQEGDVTIIPVYEEVAVIRKQLVLREEVHLTKRVTQQHAQQTVRLRQEHVDVARVVGGTPNIDNQRGGDSNG